MPPTLRLPRTIAGTTLLDFLLAVGLGQVMCLFTLVTLVQSSPPPPATITTVAGLVGVWFTCTRFVARAITCVKGGDMRRYHRYALAVFVTLFGAAAGLVALTLVIGAPVSTPVTLVVLLGAGLALQISHRRRDTEFYDEVAADILQTEQEWHLLHAAIAEHEVHAIAPEVLAQAVEVWEPSVEVRKMLAHSLDVNLADFAAWLATVDALNQLGPSADNPNVLRHQASGPPPLQVLWDRDPLDETAARLFLTHRGPVALNSALKHWAPGPNTLQRLSVWHLGGWKRAVALVGALDALYQVPPPAPPFD
jgi:hypothetical protein